MCVCVCVREREREREYTNNEIERYLRKRVSQKERERREIYEKEREIVPRMLFRWVNLPI